VAVAIRPVVSFDCYRTLIDFDLNRATLPIVRARLDDIGVEHDRFLNDLSVMRFQGVVQPYRRYKDILRDSLENCMLLHGVPQASDDFDRLWEQAKSFPAFPEVPAALTELRETHELAILTNSDDDLIPFGLEQIGVPFDYVVTAEQARAYKPRPAAFEALFARLPQRRDSITHAAQGWEYDIMPTKALGVGHRVWVNRYGRTGSPAYAPYHAISDLSPLPALARKIAGVEHP
jgi:2-haloacid dehalogenase